MKINLKKIPKEAKVILYLLISGFLTILVTELGQLDLSGVDNYYLSTYGNIVLDGLINLVIYLSIQLNDKTEFLQNTKLYTFLTKRGQTK